MSLRARKEFREAPMPDTPHPTAGGIGSAVGLLDTPEGSRPPDDLPHELSSFVGRGGEVSELKKLLVDRRLLTLHGPGGCGKTRLALALAQEVAGGFRDGVWWLDLALLSDPDLVPQAVAQALGVREAPGLSPDEALIEHLKHRETLLVLDNCEHLVGASASLAIALLRSCPGLRVLATSREALNVQGETAYLVPPLSLPDPAQPPSLGEAGRYEAVALFVERAKAAHSGFELTEQNAPAVVRLCRALDGMPLAIELAAARTRVLSIEQISSRLESSLGLLTGGSRTAEPRQRTLRATIDWSHDLLSEEERALFRRLSVFAGGFTLNAAEAVCGGEGIGPEEVLDLLASLVDKSLVMVAQRGEEARYGMLEPVRQYALELLEEGGQAEETRLRHAAFFAALAEESYPKLRAEPQVEWLRRLDREDGNLRGALSWALSEGETATAARFGFALWVFWWIRNRQPEGRRWTERILLKRDELPPSLLIRATVAAACMAYGQGDADASLRHAEELMELSRAAGGDALAEAYAHAGFGLLATERGDYEAATPHLEEALPLFREVGEVGLAAQTFAWLGTIRLLQGDHDGARRLFEEGLAMGRSLGERVSTHNALFNLAQLALAEGDYESAFLRLEEAIAPSEELGDRGSIAWILEGLGVVAGARGEAKRAARLLGASEALISSIGFRGHPEYALDRALYGRVETKVRSTLGEATFNAAKEEGRAMTPDQAIEYALEGPAMPGEEVRAEVSSAASPPAVRSKQGIHRPALEASALRIFALGPARAEKDGLPIDSPDWTHKPSELLYYLLSHPEGRTKEQIGLALWPEASTSQLRSTFHDTLYRLRRALGAKEWISYRKGRYAFERSLPYHYDVEAFEGYLSQAARLRAEAPEQAIGHLKEAADLYGGDFLEGFADGEWVLARQEELRRAYQESLLLLGGLLLARERYAEAAQAYREAIAHDRLLEEAHRGFMRSQAALGERGGALMHYEGLVALLYEQLGTQPAAETAALYGRLRAGEEP